jgi:cytochrome P450
MNSSTLHEKRRRHPLLSRQGTNHRLLDLLLSLKDEDTGNLLSKIEIRNQCATIFVAGSETTGRLMFCAIYLLTQDVEEQAKSRAEIACPCSKL